MKNYTSSPLPFQGQKRKFLKEFKKALNEFPNDATYVDLFGGSGLLSHTVKQQYPQAKVVYNDFDGFSQRLKLIPTTNEILEKIRTIVGDYPRSKRMTTEMKEQILELLKAYDVNQLDFVTLSASLLFSGKYVTNFEQLSKETFYNTVRKSNFPTAEEYLQGVEVVSEDYRKLFEKHQGENVVYLVDPPYLTTDCSTYKNYWKLTDYLDVLEVLYKKNYCYFTSNKSSIIELCEWIESKTAEANPFKEATKIEMSASVNYHSTYTDIMLYSYQNTTL